MLTCFDVANYLVWLAANSSGAITHLKLQKLTYYAQGFHLAIYDSPLFLEEIKAWDKGPVVSELWHEYKVYGSSPLPSPGNFDVSLYTEKDITLLDGVYRKLGHYSALILSNMTHQEPTWVKTTSQEIITKAFMTTYFKTRIATDKLEELKVTPTVNKSLRFESNITSSNSSSVESNIRDSKGFKAYLASKHKRFEVYKNLAES
ncbi:MAG: DUF4065 domain-containing protein [Xenococcaceae cyanobacterium MO_167.B52]|nr:DUF4065 domain-containing protein [Xenococcaceae cyanobacterium MO_167.B52]